MLSLHSLISSLPYISPLLSNIGSLLSSFFSSGTRLFSDSHEALPHHESNQLARLRSPQYLPPRRRYRKGAPQRDLSSTWIIQGAYKSSGNRYLSDEALENAIGNWQCLYDNVILGRRISNWKNGKKKFDKWTRKGKKKLRALL